MKKQIDKMKPGVDVFWALVFVNGKSARRKIVFAGKINPPGYLTRFGGKILNDKNSPMYAFDDGDDYEIIGHIDASGRYVEAENE